MHFSTDSRHPSKGSVSFVPESDSYLKWLDQMYEESRDLKEKEICSFLDKYNEKNGCPFNAVVCPLENSRGYYVLIENKTNGACRTEKIKKPFLSPTTLRRNMNRMGMTLNAN